MSALSSPPVLTAPPGLSTPSGLLQLDDLPNDLREALVSYMRTHAVYLDPYNASGECSNSATSLSTMMRMWRSRYLTEVVVWDLLGVEDKKSLVPPWVHHIYFCDCCHGPGRDWWCHCLLLVDQKRCVDFTARQVCANSPWPVIWMVH